MAVKEKFAILELDFIMVKGKKEPEVIYAIAGRDDVAQSGRFQRLRNLTIEMLACYRNRDWEGALAAIDRGRKTDDGHALASLYKLYELRIRNYIEVAAAGRLEWRVCAADEVTQRVMRGLDPRIHALRSLVAMIRNQTADPQPTIIAPS